MWTFLIVISMCYRMCVLKFEYRNIFILNYLLDLNIIHTTEDSSNLMTVCFIFDEWIINSLVCTLLFCDNIIPWLLIAWCLKLHAFLDKIMYIRCFFFIYFFHYFYKLFCRLEQFSLSISLWYSNMIILTVLYFFKKTQKKVVIVELVGDWWFEVVDTRHCNPRRYFAASTIYCLSVSKLDLTFFDKFDTQTIKYKILRKCFKDRPIFHTTN